MEFWICRSCKTVSIQYKVYKPFEKNVDVYYQRLLTFVLSKSFINVYYYFSDVEHIYDF